MVTSILGSSFLAKFKEIIGFNTVVQQKSGDIEDMGMETQRSALNNIKKSSPKKDMRREE